MAVAVVVIAVIAGALALVVAIQIRRVTDLRRALERAGEERDRTAAELARSTADLDVARADLATERETRERAEAARSELKAGLADLEARLTEATEARDRIRAELAERVAEHDAEFEAEREQRAAADRRAEEAVERAARVREEHRPGVDAEALWSLELSRAERTWRHSVAISPDQASPFDDTEDPLRVAVEVEVAALREEVGVAMELEWSAQVDDLSRRVVVLRVVQELLSAVSRSEQAVVLTATGGVDGPVELVLSAPEDHEPVGAVHLAGVEHLVTIDTGDGVRVAIH